MSTGSKVKWMSSRPMRTPHARSAPSSVRPPSVGDELKGLLYIPPENWADFRPKSEPLSWLAVYGLLALLSRSFSFVDPFTPISF